MDHSEWIKLDIVWNYHTNKLELYKNNADFGEFTVQIKSLAANDIVRFGKSGSSSFEGYFAEIRIANYHFADWLGIFNSG